MSVEGARPTWPLTAARVSFGVAGALPWALPALRAKVLPAPFGALIDAAFALVCHRMPERTLVFFGAPMPLCSRCAGIALGFFAGAVAAWPRPDLRATRAAVAVAGALVLADVVTQDLGVHPVWHATRLTTGALLGAALSLGLFARIRRERAAG